jgi:aspartate racemase
MPSMPQHIGIVACSAEGAALCYRTICVEGAQLLGGHDHPEISIHSRSLDEYIRCINRDDWAGVGELMLASANKLANIGADFLICPDNTIHRALPTSNRDRRCRGCTSREWSRPRLPRAGSNASA